MNFSDKNNLIVAKLALGEALDLFDLSNPKDAAVVSFVVKAYISGARAEMLDRVIAQKCSDIAYDSNGMLKKEYVLTEREKKYLFGMGNLIETDVNKNDYIEIIDSSDKDPQRL
jgi:hypothetical protein